MDMEKMRSVLKAFTASDDCIEIKGGTLLLQLGADVIMADISMKDGNIYMTEDGKSLSAEQWIVRRIAQIDLLAERILTNVPEKYDVCASGRANAFLP